MIGMFLGVPVCAVVYMLFKDFIENRLKKRQLPRSTAEYAKDVSYITPEYICDEPELPEEPKPEKKHGFTDVIKQRTEECKEKIHHLTNHNTKNNGKKK